MTGTKSRRDRVLHFKASQTLLLSHVVLVRAQQHRPEAARYIYAVWNIKGGKKSGYFCGNSWYGAATWAGLQMAEGTTVSQIIRAGVLSVSG